MNDVTVGRALRAIRHRMRLRQVDVAERAGVSQQLVSEVEAGRLGSITHRTFRRIVAAVDADSVILVRWRGGELDRLLDEGHADIVGHVSRYLTVRGWSVLAEVSFSEYGERGSIDILAWHPATRTLLVVEVKTEITSAEETLRRHDVKVRLAAKIGRERFGAVPAAIGRLLVVTDRSTNRRRVERLDAVLRTAYPSRGTIVRAWLAAPRGELRGLLFTAGSAVARTGRRRVRRYPSG